MGKFKSPTINHNSNFNTSKAASAIQYSSYGADTTDNLKLQQLRNIAPNSICSAVSTFQYAYWYCDYIFCNLDFTEPTELLKWLLKNPK
jgi:hypothetical protein